MAIARQTIRVGLVVPDFDKGGLQSIVFAIYKFLRDRGHEATIFVEKDEIGYYSNLLDPKDLVILRNRPEEFFAEIAIRRINVLHYHYSVFMILEVKKIGIAVIYTLHNVYTWLDDGAFRARAELINASDAVVANSSYTKSYFAGRSGSDKESLLVIPNGVDVEIFRNASPIKRDVYNISEDRYIFSQFASFHRVKHQIVLIRAAERLAKKRDDFHVIFFGNIGDERYFDEIRLAVSTSSARDHLSLPGYLNGNELAGTLLGTVDCAVLTTLQEGCGNAALEAAAIGKPLIMTDTGIARDLEKAYANIEIVPPACDVNKLTFETIEKLSRNGNTENLQAIVVAMERRLNNKGAILKAKSDKFDFEAREMLRAYEDLFLSSIRIL